MRNKIMGEQESQSYTKAIAKVLIKTLVYFFLFFIILSLLWQIFIGESFFVSIKQFL